MLVFNKITFCCFTEVIFTVMIKFKHLQINLYNTLQNKAYVIPNLNKILTRKRKFVSDEI